MVAVRADLQRRTGDAARIVLAWLGLFGAAQCSDERVFDLQDVIHCVLAPSVIEGLVGARRRWSAPAAMIWIRSSGMKGEGLRAFQKHVTSTFFMAKLVHGCHGPLSIRSRICCCLCGALDIRATAITDVVASVRFTDHNCSPPSTDKYKAGARMSHRSRSRGDVALHVAVSSADLQ